MGSLAIDSSGPRTALLHGEHLRDGGVAWTAELVLAATVSVDLRARVTTNAQSAPDVWSVEAHIAGNPLVFVDVDSDGTDDRSLDLLELRAARLWREVTREAAPFEPRPWIGAVRIGQANEPDADGVARLNQLVAARLLDAACIVMVDEAGDRVWSPNPTASLDAFQAALVGRCLYLTRSATGRSRRAGVMSARRRGNQSMAKRHGLTSETAGSDAGPRVGTSTDFSTGISTGRVETG